MAGGIVRQRVVYRVAPDENVPSYHLFRKDLAATTNFSWFGLNFRSTTPWKVTVAKDGKPLLTREGQPGDNLIVSEPLDLTHFDQYRIRLEQSPPACGHASPYLVFDSKPVTNMNFYP